MMNINLLPNVVPTSQPPATGAQTTVSVAATGGLSAAYAAFGNVISGATAHSTNSPGRRVSFGSSHSMRSNVTASVGGKPVGGSGSAGGPPGAGGGGKKVSARSQAESLKRYLIERMEKDALSDDSGATEISFEDNIALILKPTSHMGGVDSYLKRYVWYLMKNSKGTVHIVSTDNGDYDDLNDEVISVGSGQVHFHVIRTGAEDLDRRSPEYWDKAEAGYKGAIGRILDKNGKISAVKTFSTYLAEAVWGFELAKERGLARLAIYPASTDPNIFRRDPIVLGLATAIGAVYKNGVADLEGFGFPDKVYYVGPMIDLEFAERASPDVKGAFRKIDGLYDLAARTVLFAPHSIYAGKGILELLMAQRGLKEKGFKVSTVISSRIKTQEYYEELKKYADENALSWREVGFDDSAGSFYPIAENSTDITPDILFIDTGLPHSVLPEFFQSMDLTVLPSHAEAFGLSLAESWIMGVPAVATNVGGVSDGFDPSLQSSLLFALGDTTDEHAANFEAALERLLSKSKAELEQIGETGRQYIIDNLHPQKLIQHHIALIRRAIDQP